MEFIHSNIMPRGSERHRKLLLSILLSMLPSDALANGPGSIDTGTPVCNVFINIVCAYRHSPAGRENAAHALLAQYFHTLIRHIPKANIDLLTIENGRRSRFESRTCWPRRSLSSRSVSMTTMRLSACSRSPSPHPLSPARALLLTLVCRCVL